MELKAYQAYRNPEMEISFWRTCSGQEVDFILGNKEVALEIKGTKKVHEGDIYPLKILKEDQPAKRHIIVSMEAEEKMINKWIEVMPWQKFLDYLWKEKLGV